MKARMFETSPQVYARAAGLLYLLVICAGILSQLFISGKIIVAGNAAATAANILAQKSLFQLGFSLYLIEMAAQIAMLVLMYILLKPVSRSVSLLALSFGLVGCVIKTLSRLFYITPLFVLGGAGFLGAFDGDQLQALALLSLEVNDQGAGMALGFFGLSTLLNGTMIFRSTFLPRLLGVMSMLGGLGWLTYLYPPLGFQLFPFIMAVAILGSLSLIMWLIVKGVNAERWTRLAVGPD